jgi:hypothetical protein
LHWFRSRNLRHRHKLGLRQVRIRLGRHSRRLLLIFRPGRLRPLGSLRRSNRPRLHNQGRQGSLLGNNRPRLDNQRQQDSPQRQAQ